MLSTVIAKAHRSSVARLAGFVGITLLSLFSLAGCAFNYLFVIPSEAKQQQAADPVDPRQNGDVPQEIVVRNTNGHKLTGWLFAAPGDRGTVLVAGGNGMGIAHTYAYNRFLLGRHFRVLVFSYEGFDQNEGKADLATLPGDAEAFRAEIARRYPTEPIAFVGESIGAIAGFCAPQANRFSALVLEGLIDPKSIPYTVVYSYVPSPLSEMIAYGLRPVIALYASSIPDSVDAAECSIRLADAPVMFINFRDDPVSSFANIEHLVALRPTHSTLVELPHPTTKGHLVLTHRPDTQNEVVDFIEGRFGNSGRILAGAAPNTTVPR